MKRLVLVFITLVMLQFSLYSQKLYIKTSIGYGLESQKSDYPAVSTYTNVTSDTTTTYNKYDLYKLSFGRGILLDVTIGTKLQKNISFELAGFYNFCRNHKIEVEDYTNINDEYFVDINYNYEITGKMYGVKPLLQFSGNGKNIKPYIKLGGILGFCSMKETFDIGVRHSLPQTYFTGLINSVLEYQEKLTLGFQVSLGIEYNFFKKFWLTGELSHASIQYTPVKAIYSSYKKDRKEIVDDLTVNEREIEFVDSYCDIDNESPNNPRKTLKNSYSFSSLTFSIGVKMNLFD